MKDASNGCAVLIFILLLHIVVRVISALTIALIVYSVTRYYIGADVIFGQSGKTYPELFGYVAFLTQLFLGQTEVSKKED